MFCSKKSHREAAESTAASVKEQSAAALAGATSYLKAAQDKAAPLAAQAADKIGPLTEQAADKSKKAIAEAQVKLQPALVNAVDVTQHKVVPAVKQAYETFQKDVLPELEERARGVAGSPAVEEATRRGQAALHALKGQTAQMTVKAADAVIASPEVSKSTKKAAKKAKKAASKQLVAPKKSHKVLKTFLVLGALGAAGIVVARKFLTSSDDGWTAREPSATYSWTPKAPTEPTAESPAEAETPAGSPVATDGQIPAETTADVAEEMPQASGDVESPEADSAEDTSGDATMTGEGAPPLPDDETTAVSPADGSYVGDEPPQGYVIKGNDRSKKFHVPGSAGYDRTIADIWFTTEEAAEQAGFTKAQR